METPHRASQKASGAGVLAALTVCARTRRNLTALFIAIGGVKEIDKLGVAMLLAAFAAAPFELHEALPALQRPVLLLAGIGVGISSSVIPYVADQLAMARQPRATFALMLSLLPATATAIGFLVLRQIPRPIELLGIALVISRSRCTVQAGTQKVSLSQAERHSISACGRAYVRGNRGESCQL